MPCQKLIFQIKTRVTQNNLWPCESVVASAEGNQAVSA